MIRPPGHVVPATVIATPHGRKSISPRIRRLLWAPLVDTAAAAGGAFVLLADDGPLRSLSAPGRWRLPSATGVKERKITCVGPV